MTAPGYDDEIAFYVDFVDRLLADPLSFWQPLLRLHLDVVRERLPGARVLDLACGEGHLSRFLAEQGAAEVVGIDLSAALLRVAVERTTQPNVSYRQDDAQTLGTVPNASVDIVVSKQALMDIPDHWAVFQAVRRVLTSGGLFTFSILHPCFESPYCEPEQHHFVLNEAGEKRAFTVHEYAREGHWNPNTPGVRGRLGAHHRTLSTLVNDLIRSGFTLRALHEPTAETDDLFARVPRTLLIMAEAG